MKEIKFKLRHTRFVTKVYPLCVDFIEKDILKKVTFFGLFESLIKDASE